MKKAEFYRLRDDRTRRYPGGSVLPHDRWVHISVEPEYAETYYGQVAILTLANLLGRMTPFVALELPDTPMAAPLPWTGRSLRDHVRTGLFAADPHGHFELRQRRSDDVSVILGGTGENGLVVHGVGWDAYVGTQNSPISQRTVAPNPIGAAFAAVLAAAHLAVNHLHIDPGVHRFDTLIWRRGSARSHPELNPDAPLGCIWIAGAGSVGSTALYFLTLFNRAFSAAVVDGDLIEISNLGRSAIFRADADGENKAQFAAEYLTQAGVADVVADPRYLDESELWTQRQHGTPDLIIAAANERKVRHLIEMGFPPLQLYATTGKNWQTTLVRHTPLVDPCSCCLFPETEHPPTTCATAEHTTNEGEKVDASLPFLSFAAGLMTAAEILKLQLPRYPFTSNRVVLNTRPEPTLVHAGLVRRVPCPCGTRSTQVHRTMLADTRYSHLSDTVEPVAEPAPPGWRKRQPIDDRPATLENHRSKKWQRR